MFTGLIREIGTISSIRRIHGRSSLGIMAPGLASELKKGDSVAVNGVCQTVTIPGLRNFTVEALGDTLQKTTLGQCTVGQAVNLELPLCVGDKLDGHFVQGHVNGMARCLGWKSGQQSGGKFLYLDLPPRLSDNLIPEGSIAVDGVSLTVAEIGAVCIASGKGVVIRISVIPHTLASCNLGTLRFGQMVNIETDMLLRRNELAVPGITKNKLLNWGYV